MPFSSLVPLILVLFTLSAAIRQCGKEIVISGRYTCNGVGLSSSRVHFIHEVGFMRTVLGFGTTNENGQFEVRGAPIDLKDGTPSSFAVRAAYDFHDPPNDDGAKLRVIYGDVDFIDITGKENKLLEDLDKDNHRCIAYRMFYAAMRDYYVRVEDYPPKIVYVEVDLNVSGSPFADYNRVKSHKSWTWNEVDAKHELAHVVRHLFHGNRAAFDELRGLRDASSFSNHYCATSTDDIFAFNEGWAMYWANQCTEHKYDPAAPMDVAGNVAAALRNLQSSRGSSDKDMVNVLRCNKGSIFNYSDFEAAHQQEQYFCP